MIYQNLLKSGYTNHDSEDLGEYASATNIPATYVAYCTSRPCTGCNEGLKKRKVTVEITATDCPHCQCILKFVKEAA